ncbi:cytokine receptor family member b1 [Clinocottus analis]|uniref:cytokine receptor family member b1 n=1 Tax=Clinocottus analis TaxID=304258 RepID=UPI0035C1E914
MDRFPLVLYLTLLVDSVLSSLPAPVNAHVNSVNFHHVLRWNPGLGTPAGVQYKINCRVGKNMKRSSYSNTTSLKLSFRDQQKEYILTVQASYNQTLSPESNKVIFSPFVNTIIGPPKVSLAGCGSCIQINMSLPEADRSSGIKDIKKFYPGSHFRVNWRIGHTGAVMSALTPNKTYTVKNLQVGTEYCVLVHTKINTNRNTKASAWNCIFTSIVEPPKDPVFLGVVAALLILIGVLMSSMFLLYYTGFICKLKTLPRVLDVRNVLSHCSTLTLERTIPDKISIGANTEKSKRHNNPQAPHSATRGSDSYDEDEEDEGGNDYVDRDAELSAGESSCQDSVDVSGNSKLSGVSGTHGGLDQNGAKAEGTEVSFMAEGPVTGMVKEDEKEEEHDKEKEDDKKEEEVSCESFGNINLFSVTLAALAVCEEQGEEQNSGEYHSYFVKLSDLEPLLPTRSHQTLNHRNSLTESDDRTTVALILSPQEDFTEDGYEARRIATLSGCISTCDGETEEEEE